MEREGGKGRDESRGSLVRSLGFSELEMKGGSLGGNDFRRE